MTAAVTQENASGADTQSGRVVRVIGPVVDVEFPRGAIPALFNALHAEITLPTVAKTLTLEVAQHLGDNLVRTISIRISDFNDRRSNSACERWRYKPPSAAAL